MSILATGWHITHKRGVVMVTWLFKNFAVCRDAARRARSSATAELLVCSGETKAPLVSPLQTSSSAVAEDLALIRFEQDVARRVATRCRAIYEPFSLLEATTNVSQQIITM